MRRIHSWLTAMGVSFLLQNCGVICGGSYYNAHVIVKDYPQAAISFEGQLKGYGTASFRVKRSYANRFSVTVAEKGCEAQVAHYTSRSFRGWALAGTIVTWTGYVSGVYIPWGLGVDLITGSLWKPNAAENGVIKVDYKNYSYPIEYKGCGTESSIKPVTMPAPGN